MKSILLGAICLLTAIVCSAQNQFTISGYIKDATNGEALIGSAVFVKEISSGTTSNEYGFYSITLPKGSYNLEYHYMGFTTVLKTVGLSSNIRLDIDLRLTEEVLSEVVITSKAL